MEVISAGPVFTMLQNVIYALPGRKVFVYSSAAIEKSNLEATEFEALTGADTTGVFTSAHFVRCTGGNCNISVKID